MQSVELYVYFTKLGKIKKNRAVYYGQIFLALFCTLVSSSVLLGEQVAVAANFAPVFEQLLKTYKNKAGKINLAATIGSTGFLYQQIIHGAPYVIFFAADDVFPKKLVELGFAESSDLSIYGEGALVLWSHDPTFFSGSDGLKKLQTWKKDKIALPDPKLASYGKAAFEVLAKTNLTNKLDSSFVYGTNVSQVFQFVATKSVAAGFVSLSQVIANGNKGSYWQVPSFFYNPIRQQMILLQKNNKEIVDFYRFLQGKEAKAIISEFGYK